MPYGKASLARLEVGTRAQAHGARRRQFNRWTLRADPACMPSSDFDARKIAVLAREFDDQLASNLRALDFTVSWSTSRIAELRAALATQRQDGAELEDGDLEELRQAFIGAAWTFLRTESAIGQDASTPGKRLPMRPPGADRVRLSDAADEELHQTLTARQALLDSAT